MAPAKLHGPLKCRGRILLRNIHSKPFSMVKQNAKTKIHIKLLTLLQNNLNSQEILQHTTVKDILLSGTIIPTPRMLYRLHIPSPLSYSQNATVLLHYTYTSGRRILILRRRLTFTKEAIHYGTAFSATRKKITQHTCILFMDAIVLSRYTLTSQKS